MSTRISDLLTKLATNPDTKTTALGLIAAAILALQVDYPKLAQLHLGEVGKAVGVVVIALYGYYTNKQKAYPPPAPTPPPPAAGGMSSVTIGPTPPKPPK